ncbi:MAG TPA: amidase family protein [Burkholderiales bacterium]|nr:amidase family protein [Burkholderiales bacterium]
MNRLPARELARLVREKQASPVDILDAHLAAIERANPAVNAIVTVALEQAREAARAAEAAVMRGEALGPLHGVPVGIKDITPTAGIRTTWGSALFADHVPAEDAEVVRRIKRAGAIVIGKTNTPEFAAGGNTVNRVFGATRNPWGLRLSASGSTGGGAAALAAAMIPLAEGTDFGGSVRTPAAFCGVVGLRTTAGLVPRLPITLPWHDQSVTGPMARDVADCALFLDAMTGFSTVSPLSVPPAWESAAAIVERAEHLRGVRLAYAPAIGPTGIDPEVARLCREAAFALERHGASVEEVAFDLSEGCDAFVTLRGEAMVGNHLARLEKLGELNPNLAGNIRLGLGVQILDIARAEHKRAEIWHRCRALFERFDLLLTPTTSVLPFPVEQNYPAEIAGKKLESYMDWLAQTYLVSLAGLPAASVPAGLSASQLPVGLQIVGPRLSEPRILACAKLVERDHPIGWAPNAA